MHPSENVEEEHDEEKQNNYLNELYINMQTKTWKCLKRKGDIQHVLVSA